MWCTCIQRARRQWAGVHITPAPKGDHRRLARFSYEGGMGWGEGRGEMGIVRGI